MLFSYPPADRGVLLTACSHCSVAQRSVLKDKKMLRQLLIGLHAVDFLWYLAKYVVDHCREGLINNQNNHCLKLSELYLALGTFYFLLATISKIMFVVNL